MSKRRPHVLFTQYIGNQRGNTPAFLVGMTGVVTLAEQRGEQVYLYVRFPATGKPLYAAVLEQGEYEVISGTIEPITLEASSPYIGGSHKPAQQLRMNKATRRYGKRARSGAITVRY